MGRIDDFGQAVEPLAGRVLESGLNSGEDAVVAGRQDEEARAAEPGGRGILFEAPDKDRRISRKRLNPLNNVVRIEDLLEAVQDYGIVSRVAEPVEGAGQGVGVQAPASGVGGPEGKPGRSANPE
jgi:hypothetical protein